MSSLHTSGLTSAEAAEKLKQFGPNAIREKRQTSIFLQFLKQFKDILVIILIAASIFAYIAGESIDAIIIIGIVFLNAGIGFFQEFKAEKAIEALKKLLAPNARVIRDGEEKLIAANELVPGDIIILNEGDKISADCELFEENEIRVDESILTGESVPVRKEVPAQGSQKNSSGGGSAPNALFMGTQVAHGNGKAVVTKTGMRTEFGKIAALTTGTQKDLSPLQKELAHIGMFVGKVTLGISAVLVLVGIFVQGRGIIETILFAVSVAVAAVPEGLPTTITVALAIGVQRLARENAIVKQLSSVETLGSTTVICSDKTGTLTKNEMTVKEMVMEKFEVSIHGVGYEPEGNLRVRPNGSAEHIFEYGQKDIEKIAGAQPEFAGEMRLAMLCAVLCNNAKLQHIEDEWKILGDPTEGALVTLAEKAGISAKEAGARYRRVTEFPFDSHRKRMSVIVEDTKTKERFAFVKGAPDTILPLCTDIDETMKSKFSERTEAMASDALRTIALSYRKIADSGGSKKYSQDEAENNLELLGIVGMIDPPREEVKEAVKLTHKAGIRVFIITGDHGLTAHAIARELGLATSYGVNIVTGEELQKISDEKLLKLVAPGKQTIFARVSPEHKLRIVDALKKSGEVVAVTGDGVNDAPALKRADIGVAMGITGTDVSKEAANMVLADDSFGTIVTAIIEGRTIYENMKKFVFFIFSSNIGELIAIFSTIMIGLPAPLSAVLILIINTLTDVFPSLALGVEPVERNILQRPPRKPDAKIMEWPFIRRYLINGVIIGLLTAGVFVWNLMRHGWKFGEGLEVNSELYIQSSTMAFVVLTLLQMVHTWNSRSETVSVFRMRFFSNWYLLAAIAFSTIMTVAIVQIPFFHSYLETTGLSLENWGWMLLTAFSVLIFEEVRKIGARRALLAKISS